MRRYEVLQSIFDLIRNEIVVCNIGIPSQELYHIEDRDNFFYMLGSMGLCSSIALGISLGTQKNVLAIEGDGSIFMNLGSIVTIANNAPANFNMLIIDNGAYGSTGNQPTYTQGNTSIAEIAYGAGLRNIQQCEGEHTEKAIQNCLNDTLNPGLIVSKVAPGNAKVDPIPLNPVLIKHRFKKNLSSNN